MAFAIYKSGQGYWTRVLTAIGAGALVLASVAWLWAELDGANFAIDRQHPLAIDAQFEGAENRLAALGIGLVDQDPQEPGELKVDVVSIQSPAKKAGLGRADVITHVEGVPVSDTKSLLAALEGLAPGQTFNVTIKRSQSIVLYVQAGAAVVIIGTFALVLWIVLNKPRTVDFMIATEAEMRKVNWPSRHEIVGSTLVVVCGTALLAMVLFVVNIVFGFIFTEINILEKAEQVVK